MIDLDVWRKRNDVWASDLKATERLKAVNIEQKHPSTGGSVRIDSQVRQIISLLADSKLEHLTLRRLEISSIPEDIRRLRGLKYLILQGLALKELPDWIG